MESRALPRPAIPTRPLGVRDANGAIEESQAEDLRVVVVDDQAVVRRGVAVLVEMIGGVSVVATARSGEEALEAVVVHVPHVVLLDLRMPGLDGIETTRRMRRVAPATAIVILTSYTDGESVLAALLAGASGYVTKEADIDEVERAVRAAAAGQSVLSAGIRQRMLAASGSPSVDADPDLAALYATPDPGFTPREREVLALIARGMSNREIATECVITEVTVKTHVNRIFAKSGSRDRAQAVRYAFRHGYVDG